MELDQQTTGAPARGTRGGPVGWFRAVRLWPRRRWTVVAVLIPLATAVFVWVGLRQPAGVATASWNLPIGVVAGVLAGLTLGSYVAGPGSGRWFDVGCSPCALVSAVSVFVALALRWNNPFEVGPAVASIVILAIGLQRRVSDAATCQVGTQGSRPE